MPLTQQEERRTSFILKKQEKHPVEFENPFFKFMVDYTMLLTKQEVIESRAHMWDCATTTERRSLLLSEQEDMLNGSGHN